MLRIRSCLKRDPYREKRNLRFSRVELCVRRVLHKQSGTHLMNRAVRCFLNVGFGDSYAADPSNPYAPYGWAASFDYNGQSSGTDRAAMFCSLARTKHISDEAWLCSYAESEDGVLR